MEALFAWLAAGGCGEGDARHLEALVEEYPYFFVPRILCLKRAHDVDRSSYPTEARRHAMHVPDACLLYRYFHRLPPFEERAGEEYTFELEPCVVAPLPAVPYRLEDEFPEEDAHESHDASPEEDPIDVFIRKEPVMPRISPDVKAGETPQPETDDEFFSETLAKIYVKQKLYDKAIATYMKLSLIYPEKSIYFARLIENTRELTKK
jgi:hypothetical protein